MYILYFHVYISYYENLPLKYYFGLQICSLWHVIINFMCLLVTLKIDWAKGWSTYCLWVCLWEYFWKYLAFNSVDWVKKSNFLIPWGPEDKKKRQGMHEFSSYLSLEITLPFYHSYINILFPRLPTQNWITSLTKCGASQLT